MCILHMFIYTHVLWDKARCAALRANRSICLLRLGELELALSEAEMCVELRPDWPKAIYIYIYIYIHTHTYIHTCIHAYMHTCIHAYMHTCIHAYMHTYIHTYIHTYTHTYIHPVSVTRFPSFRTQTLEHLSRYL